MERSKAKVWTIFGKPNREWYLGSRQRLDSYEFVPPDGNATTKFTLEYGTDNKLRRVAFFCDHPQYIYHPQDLLKGLIMDQALNLTAALAGITVKTQYLDRFYQSILKRFSTRKRRSRRYDRGEMIVASSRCLEQQQLSSRPLTFDGLDLTLRDWLQAQGVENAKDAAEWSAKQGAEKLTIVEAVHSVLLTENAEQLAGSSEPVLEHENFSETEELEHGSLSELSQIKRPGYEARRERLDDSKFRSMYRFADEAKGDPATMEVKCEKCGEVQTDDIPTYDHTGAYIVRQMAYIRCKKSSTGQTPRLNYLPVNVKVSFVAYQTSIKDTFYRSHPSADGAKEFRENHRIRDLIYERRRDKGRRGV